MGCYNKEFYVDIKLLGYNMLINSALSVSGFSRIGAKITLSSKARTQIDLI